MKVDRSHTKKLDKKMDQIFLKISTRVGLMVSAPDFGASGTGLSAVAGDIVLCSWARHSR